MLVFVGLLNLALVRWSRFLDEATEGRARMHVIWPLMALTWSVSGLMWLIPTLGLLNVKGHVGFDLVSVTGTAIVFYWLLRLQIGIWAKELDL